MKHSLSILYLSMVSLYQPSLMASHQGYSGIEPPKTNDTTFVLDAGPIEAAGVGQGAEGECPSPFSTDRCIPLGPSGSITFRILVNRVVGDVNADGTLASPVELDNNGVVSQFAKLRLISGYTIDGTHLHNVYSPPQFRILFNDQDMGPVQYIPCGECTDYRLDEYQIPIEWVRFGKKKNWGENPTPGENALTIKMGPYGGDPTDTWGITVDWGAILFEAMSPLVLVHGIASDYMSWDKGGFADRLKEKKIPFEYENINLSRVDGGNGTVKANAVELAPLLNLTAKTFGVNSLHLISHSKGGLDIRFYLGSELYSPPPKGTSPLIKSHFTIDTPHHGAVLADIGEVYEDSVNEKVAIGLGSESRDTLLRNAIEVCWLNSNLQFLPKRPGRSDLTVVNTAIFNLRNSLPKDILFSSFGADADTNSDRNIDSTESAIMFPFPVNFSSLPTLFYRVLGEISRIKFSTHRGTDASGRGVTFKLVTPVATTSFELNDIAVTVESAKYSPPYRPLHNFRHNHASVKSPETANLILREINSNFPFK